MRQQAAVKYLLKVVTLYQKSTKPLRKTDRFEKAGREGLHAAAVHARLSKHIQKYVFQSEMSGGVFLQGSTTKGCVSMQPKAQLQW